MRGNNDDYLITFFMGNYNGFSRKCCAVESMNKCAFLQNNNIRDSRENRVGGTKSRKQNHCRGLDSKRF